MTFITEAARDLDRRITEARDEMERLSTARSILAGEQNSDSSPTLTNGSRSPRARRRRQSSDSSPAVSNGSPSPRGARQRQILELIDAQPGITTAELQDVMSTHRSYVFHLVKRLKDTGAIEPCDAGWKRL